MTQLELQPGDVLLFHPSSLTGHIVAWATGSVYSHAAMYTDEGVAELREFLGGRILPLTDHAGESIDVFRADTTIPVKIVAVMTMKQLLSERYSFLNCIAAWFRRRIPKWFRLHFLRSEVDHHGYHCSQAVATAYRIAGLDLCRHPDWATTPGDLARSKRLTPATAIRLED